MEECNQLKERIINALQSGNMGDAISSIKLIAELPPDEAIAFAESILYTVDSLGMKLEVLRILPRIMSSETRVKVSNLLEKFLHHSDPELVRNALLVIRDIIPNNVSNTIPMTVLGLLKSSDTDIQYEAVLTALHLRSRFPPNKLTSYLEPLAKQPNKVLREIALSSLEALKHY